MRSLWSGVQCSALLMLRIVHFFLPSPRQDIKIERRFVQPSQDDAPASRCSARPAASTARHDMKAPPALRAALPCVVLRPGNATTRERAAAATTPCEPPHPVAPGMQEAQPHPGA